MVCVSSTRDFAPGVVVVEEEDLERHETPPITMGVNFTYRSAFEDGLEGEALVFEPEGTTPEDDAAPLVEGCWVWALIGGDNAEDFTEAAARFMAARPLTLVAGA